MPKRRTSSDVLTCKLYCFRPKDQRPGIFVIVCAGMVATSTRNCRTKQTIIKPPLALGGLLSEKAEKDLAQMNAFETGKTSEKCFSFSVYSPPSIVLLY